MKKYRMLLALRAHLGPGLWGSLCVADMALIGELADGLIAANVSDTQAQLDARMVRRANALFFKDGNAAAD